MKELDKYIQRINNIELRSCGKSLLEDEPHITMNVVGFGNKKHCWSVAYWVRDSGGYDLKFVGDRPFADTINKDHLWKLFETGQEILDEYFNQTEDYDE